MSDTRLRLILELRDKVLAPLRGIQSGSKDAAAALKATRDQLRGLEKAQQDIDGLRKTRAQLRGQQRDLQELQTKLTGSNASLVEHRERHKNIAASLKTARESHSKLTKALQDGATATPEFSRQLEMARIRLLSSQTAYERSNSTLSKYRTQIKTTEAGIAQLSGKIDNGKDRLFGYQQRLERAGISTDKLGQQSRNQKIQIEAATAAMERQKQALAGLKAQQEKLAALKEGHAKAMMHTGMVAGAGVAMVAAGRTVAKPVRATLGAFSQQEDASTQLRAAMMQSDGSVQAEFAQIDALAKRLGDRLPGTTADFIEMMTVLRKEGISAQAILGGTGEAAALLGVQLKMPVTAAAAFAAKMQDATQATEGEMLSLMDVLQKNAYLGADQNYQLNGITAMAGAMGLLRLKGEEAYKALSPMLVMMNQAGMTDGGSAGNAINKVFEAGLDTKKLKKVNDLLKQSKTGIKLNFADKGGKFAGIENFFAQLEKLKKLGENDILKTEVFKELFGTDKENRQVLNNFIAKGYDGYKETVAKMDAQASLQQRVNEQLGTLSNVMEAAQGGFTNVMADIGATIKDDAKDVIKAIGDITSSVGGWIKQHPALTAGIARTMAVLAGLMVVLGTLLIPLALIAGKFMLMRFLFGMLSIKVPVLSTGIQALVGMVSKLTGALLSGLMVALRAATGVIVRLGAVMLATPVGWLALAIAGIAVAGALLLKYWQPIKAFFRGFWQGFSEGLAPLGGMLSSVFSGIGAALEPLRPVWQWLGSAISKAWGWMTRLLAPVTATQEALNNATTAGHGFGAWLAGLVVGLAKLIGGFFSFGASLVRGLADGIASMVGAVIGVVSSLASTVSAIFTRLWQSIKATTSMLWQSIISAVSILWSGATALARSVWGGLAGFFAGMWQGIKDTASAVWSGIASMLSLMWAAMVNTASTIWQQMGGSFPAVLQTISTAIVNWSPLGLFYQAFASVMSYFGVELPTKFSEFGANIIQGLVNGITSKLAMVREAVGGAADSAIGWFKEKLGIHSPSRVFMAAGVNVGEGAAIGIDRTLGMVRKSAAAMAMATGVTLAAPTVAAPVMPVQQIDMPAKVAQIPAVADQERPPAAQPLLPMLQNLPPVPAQVVQLQSAAAQALPPAAQTLLPALQKLPPVPAQAVQLQPVMKQMPAMSAQQLPAMPVMADPVQIDRRPVLAAPAPAVARPAPVIHGDTITIQIHAAPGMDLQAIGREVERVIEQRERAKAARLQSSFTDWN
ncbi:phage tail tape measure protein [Comamonas testosteroni]|uniref:phage tail tape measure protein n=1 Tax=Comamonas testosteroni TaxID=285 RepID=UPI000313013F|nr:phage tail tape measure protein [Comamonas testosteroni]